MGRIYSEFLDITKELSSNSSFDSVMNNVQRRLSDYIPKKAYLTKEL